ncbi:hypothetical protein [Levilactobacillus koreensis]|uniref:Uncharacterized protein n=1 Tax=Levilactobacillus koreensis TaxID=637971 RepID=A0AAC8UVI5_9LACO|nr:hypothetical protein [Levilactobacillus koreensis]AKP64494.1 hypothetical protein ABN16_05455 [Levilactobacillus koreensis]
MTSNRQVIRGNDNIQQNGDNNHVTNYFGYNSGDLTESEIYELLKIFVTSDIPGNVDFANTNPAKFKEKLLYNNVTKYKFIFDEYFEEQFTILKISEDFPDSEPIMRKLRTLFYDEAKFYNHELVVGDGDKQLDEIYEKISRSITHDPRFIDSSIKELKMDAFVYGLMSYGILKCKILKNPNEESGD